jgi:O-antigen biosynthesis protein WbqP
MDIDSSDQAKRAIDVAISAAGLFVLALPLGIIGLVIRASSPGPAIHWSRRVGKGNREFLMPKFRTMRIDTPQLATHLLTDADCYLTPVGRVLRRTSLDELPQLVSILRGDMSIVGPRPALYNQDDLIRLRTERGIHQLTPGLTGWAQVNGRDDLPIPVKVSYEEEYLKRRSLTFDLRIVVLTATQAFVGKGVDH